VRSGAAAGHRGYFHETAFYESDDDFRAIVVPFLQGGVEAGEPTVVALNDRNAALVRAELPADSEVAFLPGVGQYTRPAPTIAAFRKLFGDHVDAGATQIRVVGEVPHSGTGTDWDCWGRYEAVVNHAYDDFPLWGMCPYDMRTTPDHVLDEVRRTHPHVASIDDRHDTNPLFEDPADFLRRRNGSSPRVPEQRSPVVELFDPTPAEARHATRAACRTAGADPTTTDDLVVAVSEVTANALLHGRPPTRFRLWPEPEQIVATVTDAGAGPDDPFVGLLPVAADAPSGRGLWVVHHLCDHVSMHDDHEGFTIRLVVGASTDRASAG
jgi:anti-sigma regulatory factor (Ser/Thr protein kinase)